MPAQSEEAPSKRRRKLAMKARELGLTDDERMQLASYLLRRDVTTWSTLDDGQVSRLLDVFEGFELLTELARQRA